MRKISTVLGLVSVLVFMTCAQAWNTAGHMVSAAIAYADLKSRRSDVLAKVIEVLKHHPDFDSMWANQLSDADDQDLLLLMLAARWPDDLRDRTHKFDHWHWVNIPYSPGRDGVVIPDSENIITAFAENRAIAKTTADVKEQAVAICWMLHLIGDIHQPLHTTTLITDKYPAPDGDNGGNRFLIRVKTENQEIKLHAFWDGLVAGSSRFQSVRNKVTSLRNKPGMTRGDMAGPLAVHSVEQWALESRAIAVAHAYLNGALKDGGAVLPPGYKERAKQTAERQIVLSGYRISDAMVTVFGQ